MRVLLVTSWDVPCGIAEHSRMLIQSIEAADPKIAIHPDSAALDPEWVLHYLTTPEGHGTHMIHLNHHDGLHSRWTPAHVEQLTQMRPVLVTYHDTRGQLVDCPKLQALAQVASSVVVHEPVEGLNAIYWKQGIPAAAHRAADYVPQAGMYSWMDGTGYYYSQNDSWKAYPQQPVLGTVGFNFPWKNFGRLAHLTGELGWALVLLSNNATEEDEKRWRALNSAILVIRKFLPQDVAINYLAGCDATAFMYECANTGTSAAIRMGLAARKPVIALKTCRQFRDLYLERDESGALWGLGRTAINWVDDWDQFRYLLQEEAMPHRYDVGVCALAHRDRWEVVGTNYAQLYRMLTHRVEKG